MEDFWLKNNSLQILHNSKLLIFYLIINFKYGNNLVSKEIYVNLYYINILQVQFNLNIFKYTITFKIFLANFLTGHWPSGKLDGNVIVNLKTPPW